MQKISEIHSTTILESLINSTTLTSNIDKTDEQYAEIQSLQAEYKQIEQTPDVLRFMMQLEYSFVGSIDGFAKDSDEFLQHDWYDSSFVVVNYAKAEQWLRKAIEEAEKGKTIVCVVPSKTHTGWFHDLVLARANKIKFLKGRLKVNNGKFAGPADVVCVHQKVPNKTQMTEKRKKRGYAMIRCKVNMTDTEEPQFSSTRD